MYRAEKSACTKRKQLAPLDVYSICNGLNAEWKTGDQAEESGLHMPGCSSGFV